jgi:hypothetical protein
MRQPGDDEKMRDDEPSRKPADSESEAGLHKEERPLSDEREAVDGSDRGSEAPEVDGGDERSEASVEAEPGEDEDDEEEGNEELDEDNEAPALEVYRSQSRRTRRKIALICVFVALHASTVLVKGLKPEIRDFLWPALAWYGDGLRMATTWGMFGAEHTNASLYSVGIDAEGNRHAIYPRPRGEATVMERLRNTRLRKIQSNLKKEKNHKSWGKAYGEYWCKNPPRGLQFSRVVLETADDFDEEKFPRTVVVNAQCQTGGIAE